MVAVSVVIPTLNRLPYLREALQSVLAQDYPGIECIVMDAGSTDGTVEYLRSVGDRIRWVSEPDGGPFNAINRGWHMSSGEIVTWLNDDDRWAPGCAARAVAYFEAHPEIDVVNGRCQWIDLEGRPGHVAPAEQWQLRGAILECRHYIHQPAAFLRRSIVERVGGLTPYWFHDQDLWLRIGLAGGTFGTIDEVQAEARIHHGLGGQQARAAERGKVAMVERWFRELPLPAEYRSCRARAISNAHAQALDYLWPANPRDWLLGPAIVARALRTDPSNTGHLAAHVARLVWTYLARTVLHRKT